MFPLISAFLVSSHSFTHCLLICSNCFVCCCYNKFPISSVICDFLSFLTTTIFFACLCCFSFFVRLCCSFFLFPPLLACVNSHLYNMWVTVMLVNCGSRILSFNTNFISCKMTVSDCPKGHLERNEIVWIYK